MRIVAKRLYNEPQMRKLIGVTNDAKAVVSAVSETESSTLPFDNDVIKLEILPPGHDATKIIPMATIGVINGLRTIAKRQVTAGRITHCNSTPRITDFGFLKTSLNVLTLMPRATPNITNAKIKLTNNISPAPRLMVRLSRVLSSSFI